METKNVMIVGVGGQGSLLASRLLGNLLTGEGYDVKVSEVHGMSQRGGSVVTYVKFGEKIYSPIICKGEADVILSFEQLEAARWLPYLKKGGVIVTSEQKINPMPVITGAAEYPSDVIGKIKDKDVTVISANTLDLAREAGSEKASNVALIGLASGVIGFDEESLKAALRASVPEKFLEMNLRAFDLGVKARG